MSRRHPLDVNGKDILIIGASTPKPGLPSGIGWEAALEFARRGANIKAAARWTEGIPDDLPTRIDAEKLDLGNYPELDPFVRRITMNGTKVPRVIWLNAGQLPRDDSAESWYQNLMINLLRPGYLLLLFIEIWLQLGKPATTFMVTSSFGTMLGMQSFISYLVSKIGLEMLVRLLRIKYPGIDLRLVWSGIVATAIWDPKKLTQTPDWYIAILMKLATSSQRCAVNIVDELEAGVINILATWDAFLARYFGLLATPGYKMVEEIGLSDEGFAAVMSRVGRIRRWLYPHFRAQMKVYGMKLLVKK